MPSSPKTSLESSIGKMTVVSAWLEDLAQPLIALGLATDINFVQKTLKVLNPEKSGEVRFGTV